MNKLIPITVFFIIFILASSLLILHIQKRNERPVEETINHTIYETPIEKTPTPTPITRSKVDETTTTPTTITRLICKYSVEVYRVINITINITVELMVYAECDLYLHNVSFIDKDGNKLYYVELNKLVPPRTGTTVPINVATDIFEKTDKIVVKLVVQGEVKTEILKPEVNETATYIPW